MAASNKQNHEDHADGIVEAGEKVPGYFYVLFGGLIIWGALFMGYYLLSGWSSDQEFQEKMQTHTAAYAKSDSVQQSTAAAESAKSTPATATTTPSGSDLYADKCAGCHGADAKGGYGSDLTGDYQFGKTLEQIGVSISEGRGGKMPAFGKRLSAAEIDALSNYLLQL